MKKILCVLIVALVGMMILACTVVYAEAQPPEADGSTVNDAGEEIVTVEAPAEVKDEQVPFTWAYLATIAGATAATLLIVQFLKLPLDKVFGHIPTRIVAYVIALVLMLVSTFFTTGLTAENALLAAVNAFVVALAAMGSYEVTFAKANR